MFLFSALLYTLLYNSGGATPLSLSFNPISSLLPRDAEPTVLACPRKPLEIIWSCIATILAATWVSVHPNMPHSEDSKLKKTLRRIELMFWAIFIPELIVFWAMRQWYGARSMEKEFKEYQKARLSEVELQPLAREDTKLVQDAQRSFAWTKTHGFFLQMGGFVLNENGKSAHVLGWKTLMGYYKAGRIDMSTVTEASINDRSKADGFAKGLALLQTLWFIIQCVARFSDDHLVLTELELVTAALAVLSMIMYVLWWNKPFNAEIPIVITLFEIQDGRPSNELSSRFQEPGRIIRKSVLSELKNALYESKNILRRIGQMLVSNGDPFSPDQPDPTDYGEPIMKISTFYSVTSPSESAILGMRLACFVIGTLFGAIHCAGWSRKIVFSSHTSSLLWRISSGFIAATPFAWGSIFVMTRIYTRIENDNIWEKGLLALRRIIVYLSLLSIPFYIASRIVLLVLALVELRHIPPGALANLNWAHVLPFVH